MGRGVLESSGDIGGQSGSRCYGHVMRKDPTDETRRLLAVCIACEVGENYRK